jgi:hypothetical protein
MPWSGVVQTVAREFNDLGDAFNEHRVVSHLAQMLKSDDPEQVQLPAKLFKKRAEV